MSDTLSPSAMAAIADAAVDAEISERESQDESQAPRARKDGKRGRSAFAADICEIHPTYHNEHGDFVVATLEKPCAKFGHLPGNGRGPYKPNILRQTRSFVVGLIKPIVLIGIVLGALYCGKVFLPNLFSADRFVPSAPSSGANANRDSNGNGNGNAGAGANSDRDRSANGIAGNGQPQSRTPNAVRDCRSHAATAAAKRACGPKPAESVKR